MQKLLPIRAKAAAALHEIQRLQQLDGVGEVGVQRGVAGGVGDGVGNHGFLFGKAVWKLVFPVVSLYCLYIV